MIKTSGYRVSPTEIEEVVYATGLVGDAVALGVDDERSASPSCSSSARPTARARPDELLAELRQQLPLYMVPSESSSAPSCRARRTASSTATCCARSWRPR